MIRLDCRSCAGKLEEILNLGNLRLNAFPPTALGRLAVPSVPLILMLCRECGLVQLDRSVPPDMLYREYWYRSGINESMVAELRSIVEEACSLVPLAAGDTVMDVGANDGTLLQGYADRQGYTPIRVAVEPARNLHDRLRPHCDALIGDYFPGEGWMERYNRRVSILTAIACAYDVEDPLGFFFTIHDLLTPHGVAIIQFQDLGTQIESAAFDNICHEHLEYYTLWSLTHLFIRAGLTIQRVTRTPINGGSLRLVLRRVEDHVQPELNVLTQLVREAGQWLDTPAIRGGNRDAFLTLARRVHEAQRQIRAVIDQSVAEGACIDLYGASTKGNILLQVLGLGPDQIRQAVDRSIEKVGTYTVTGIPIVGEETAKLHPADIWLCPIWQFRESVLARNAWYLEQGGTMIFPLPQVEIVRGHH